MQVLRSNPMETFDDIAEVMRAPVLPAPSADIFIA
jgi:hypothetical protein